MPADMVLGKELGVLTSWLRANRNRSISLDLTCVYMRSQSPPPPWRASSKTTPTPSRPYFGGIFFQSTTECDWSNRWIDTHFISRCIFFHKLIWVYVQKCDSKLGIRFGESSVLWQDFRVHLAECTPEASVTNKPWNCLLNCYVYSHRLAFPSTPAIDISFCSRWL